MGSFGVLFAIVFAVVMGLFVVALVYVIAKATSTAWRNLRAPALTAQATVVGERTQVRSRDNGATTVYFATFEFPDRSRIELQVPGEAAGQLVVGDQGTLYWKGTSFNGFQREILR